MKDDLSVVAWYFPFPAMFTIEAWVKLILEEPVPDDLIMPIFGKYTATDPTSLTDRTYKVGFAINNKFLRVYVDTKFYDMDYNF